MASPARRIAIVLRIELLFLAVTWLAGIYVNGYVSILPDSDAEAIVLNPAVATHIGLASLGLATGLVALSLAWVAGSRRAALFAFLAVCSMVAAGGSGLFFVLGGAIDSSDSLIMATSFVTALFLSFLALGSLRSDGTSPVRSAASKRRAPGTITFLLCCLVLALFYAVFVSGIYVNLYVAGPVFSLPLNSELAAFTRAEQTITFILHEGLGAALLAMAALLAIATWSAGEKRLGAVSAIAALLVSYSAYVGSTNLTSPPVPAVPAGALSALVPMLSAAAFIAALLIAMMVSLRMRTETATR